MNKSAALCSVWLAVLCAQPASADSCRFSATRTATIDGGPFRKVIIGAGAGDLLVRGDKALGSPRAGGKACASSQELLDKIRLDTHQEGDTLYITTVLPENEGWHLFGDQQAHLDLSVDLPETMATEIEDSSGGAEIRGIGSSSIADSSGELRISDIHGDLSVTDSSGGIYITNVAGNARIEDSSGEMEVVDVTGNVNVPVDSSGAMRLRQIGGSVEIGTDSSGDIAIQTVGRDVTIDRDSSGDITVTDVAGNLTVHADSSGDIDHQRVLGKIDLPREDH
jgi:hypothetical protein